MVVGGTLVVRVLDVESLGWGIPHAGETPVAAGISAAPGISVAPDLLENPGLKDGLVDSATGSGGGVPQGRHEVTGGEVSSGLEQEMITCTVNS